MRKTNEQFILEAKNIHTDENNNSIYDYSQVNYITTHKKVNIICKIHGSFEQCPSDHLSGKGCKKCGINIAAKKQTFSKEHFIQTAKGVHGDNFDYSRVNYINSQTKITLKCNICEYVFEKTPNSHLQGCGCDKCAHVINHKKQKLSETELIERAKEVHGDKFDYPDMNYVNSQLPINIKCNKCDGTFQQLYPNHIKQNKGCPLCEGRTTAKILFDYLTSNYPTTIREFKQEWCRNIQCLPFDFYIPELKIIVELDGNHHFIQVMNWKSPEETQKTDIYKMKCANEHNLSVIRIVQTDVLHNKYNWKEELLNNIEKIKTSISFKNIYMCKNNEYENYPM
jgi:very-short-patch-repair endonuclease